MTEHGPEEPAAAPEPAAQLWPEADPDPGVYGVLLSNYIKKYAKLYKLIEPFEERSLQAASYTLHVGDEFWLNDKLIKPDERNQIEIPMNGLLYFSIKETLNLPPYLIAMHDLKVKEVYRGLLVGRSVHVGPDYSGQINYPIFNFTSQNRVLKVGQEIATIIFVKTTPFGSDCKRSQRIPNRRINEYWKDGETHVSAVLQLQDDFKDLRQTHFENLRIVVERFRTVGYIAAIALAVAIMLGIFVEIRWVADKVDALSQRAAAQDRAIAAHEKSSASELAKAKGQIDALTVKQSDSEGRIRDQLRAIETRVDAIKQQSSVPKKPKP